MMPLLQDKWGVDHALTTEDGEYRPRLASSGGGTELRTRRTKHIIQEGGKVAVDQFGSAGVWS